MGIFGKMKDRFSGSVNKFSGRKDFLEAVCAAAALVSAADGDIEDSEIATTIKTITSNPGLAGAFASREIETTADTMLKRAQAGRSGRMGLWKEIEEIAKDPEMAEVVYVTALDVSESDGEIEAAEQVVLEKLAKTLGVNPEKFAV